MKKGITPQIVGAMVVTVVLLLATATQAEIKPQGPSFDCDKASDALEEAICGDDVIASLDGALAKVYSAKLQSLESAHATALRESQREWVNRRYSECHVAKKPFRRLSVEELWQVGPCLVSMYRNRLVELGDPQQRGNESSAMEGVPGFIHPHCLNLAIGSLYRNDPPRMRLVPLDACNRGNAYHPVRLAKRTLFDRPIEMIESSPLDEFGSFLSYRLVGQVKPGVDLAVVQADGTGTSVLTELAVISREMGPSGFESFSVVRTKIGGDRCSGGIAAAKANAGDALVTIEFTPSSLLHLLGWEGSAAATGAPTFCIGTAELQWLAATNEGKVSTINLDGYRSKKFPPGSKTPDDCLAKAAQLVPNTSPQGYDEAGMRALHDQYSGCLVKGA